MSRYPALTSMGVQNPEQIARFATYTTEDYDILRIIYERKKGSLLPVSRKYKFDRIKKSTIVDSGTRQTEVLFESAPEFQNALDELGQLMSARESKDETRKLIAEEVASLEEDVAARMSYIKSMMDKL